MTWATVMERKWREACTRSVCNSEDEVVETWDMSGNKTNAAPHGKVWRCKTCKEFSKWKDTVSLPDQNHEHELELIALQVIMDGK